LGERAAIFGDFSQADIDRLDGIGGVNDSTYFRRIVLKRDDVIPITPPYLGNRRVANLAKQLKCAVLAISQAFRLRMTSSPLHMISTNR